MSLNESQTLLLTVDLGSVGDYDSTAPLTRVVNKNSLRTGHLYLRATLEEMVKIRGLSKNLDENHHDLLRETRAKFDNLMERKKELELLEKRKWLFKLFRSTSIRRAKQEFVHSTIELWDSTMTTSDRLKRTLISTPTIDLAQVECESVAEDESISGVAIEMDGPITEEAIAIVQEAASLLTTSGDPFADPTPSDRQTLSERSSISINVNYNVISNVDTNTPGFTINNNGTRNSGSVTSPRSSVNSPPS